LYGEKGVIPLTNSWAKPERDVTNAKKEGKKLCEKKWEASEGVPGAGKDRSAKVRRMQGGAYPATIGMEKSGEKGVWQNRPKNPKWANCAD